MATPNKIVISGVEARKRLIKGADFLADAVKSTLGPFGQNWFLEKGNKITNDGATVAFEVSHSGEVEQRGLTALREATMKVNEMVGDGTTSATVLAQAILKSGVKNLSDGTTFTGKMTPAELIRKIETEKNEVIEKLKAMATPITTEAELIGSAKVSVEDDELANMIGKTQHELGPQGVILAEETAEPTSSIERVRGVRVDNGFGTSLLINNQEKQSLELSNVPVLLTTNTITTLKPLQKFGETLVKTGQRQLVIVARAWSSEAIKDCMANIKAGFAIWPINAPYTDQAEVMKDLAAVLGARFIDAEAGSLADAQISDLGQAEKIDSKRSSTIFSGVKNEKTDASVAARLEELKKKLKGSLSEFEKRLLTERIAQMENGYALLKIGAKSDKERGYRKDKADDAVNAVRAAYQEGTVPGAGLAFKEISESLPESYILKRPLMSIYEEIMSRAPADFKIEDWVRDPVKVLRIALEEACSVAGTFATAGGATATEKEKPRFVQETARVASDEEEEAE